MFNESGGIAGNDGPRFDIVRDNSASAEDGTATDSYTGGDKGAGANPRLFVDENRCREQAHVRIVDIVCGRAKKGFLRDRRVSTDADPINAVAIHGVPQGCLFADREIPRCPDAYCGINPGIASHCCPETTQDHTPPSITDPRAGPKQKGPHHTPGDPSQLVTKRMSARTFALPHAHLKL